MLVEEVRRCIEEDAVGVGEGGLMCSGHSGCLLWVLWWVWADGMGTSETSGISVTGSARSERDQCRRNHSTVVREGRHQRWDPHYVARSLHEGESSRRSNRGEIISPAM